jgi:regulator of sigma E protease
MSWLLAFAGFAALIILHEFGHFLAAKWTGMRVERFFLFFPPRIWSVKRGETEYGIGAIPAGGFVKITGMTPEELFEDDRPRRPGEEPKESPPPEVVERAYYKQPAWKRIVVISAGPAMNVLIAFLLFFVLAFSEQRPTAVEVADIESDSPAQGVLQSGDRPVSIDGIPLTQGGLAPSDTDLDARAEQFAKQVDTHACAVQPPVDGCKAATPAQVVVERDGREQALQVTPFYDADAPALEEGEMGRNRLGFRFDAAGEVPVDPSTGEAAGDALDDMWFITSQTITVFARIIDPEQREQISGVVGSYETTRQAINLDARLALIVIAVISLSLAIINLFPFLPLDGGHIFWTVVETIRGGRRVPLSVVERVSAVGMLFVILLVVIGLTNDLDRIVTGEGFGIR